MAKMKLLVCSFVLILTIPFNVSAQKSIPKLKPTLIDRFDQEDFKNRCSLGCAIGWVVEASSSLDSDKGNQYDAKKLDDANYKTAWIEGKSDYGIGEYVIFRFPKKDWDKGGARSGSMASPYLMVITNQ